MLCMVQCRRMSYLAQSGTAGTKADARTNAEVALTVVRVGSQLAARAVAKVAVHLAVQLAARAARAAAEVAVWLAARAAAEVAVRLAAWAADDSTNGSPSPSSGKGKMTSPSEVLFSPLYFLRICKVACVTALLTLACNKCVTVTNDAQKRMQQ